MSHLICTNNPHGDHLGSANWITDGWGKPIQYIHYAPYGELIENQHIGSWCNERYKFTGKERDAETGYDYFGARYYASGVPMAENLGPDVPPSLYDAMGVQYTENFGRDEQLYMA